MLSSLRGKILFITSTVLCLSISVVVSIVIFNYIRDYEEVVISEGVAAGQTLKYQLRSLLNLDIPIEGLTGFDKQCSDLNNRYERISDVLVISPQGKILFRNDESKHDEIIVVDFDGSFVNGTEQFYYQKVVNDKYCCSRITIPVRDRYNMLVGAIVIEIPRTVITDKAWQIAIYSILVTIVLLIVSTCLLVIILRFWVTGPFNNFINLIEGIRKKRTNVQMPQEKFVSDEISSLLNTFNNLMLELNESYDQLETRVKERTKELDLANKELRKALVEVKTLSGFLPICTSCKKIRDDKGYWNQVEVYIRDRSEAEFSHSICPDCAEKLYPGMDLYRDEEKE